MTVDIDGPSFCELAATSLQLPSGSIFEYWDTAFNAWCGVEDAVELPPKFSIRLKECVEASSTNAGPESSGEETKGTTEVEIDTGSVDASVEGRQPSVRAPADDEAPEQIDLTQTMPSSLLDHPDVPLEWVAEVKKLEVQIKETSSW